MTRRIGLFGGSFDPVHMGHLHVARAARERFGLERVVFMPAAEPPHKPERQLARAADRLAMLELALAGEPTFEISTLELERGGRSFTIDTVRALETVFGSQPPLALYLILGSDNLPGLPTWREARRLLERVEPVIVQRVGKPRAALAAAVAALGPELGAKLERGYLALPPVPISSTAVRHAAGERALDPRWLDPRVAEYIRAHALYGARP